MYSLRSFLAEKVKIRPPVGTAASLKKYANRNNRKGLGSIRSRGFKDIS